MKRLVISFRTSDNRTRTFTYRDPKDGVTADQVQDLGNAMIGTVVPSDWQLDRAAIINTETNELFDLIQ